MHAAWFALPARARADHEIVRSARDRLNEFWYESWDIASIAIEKQYDITFRRDRTSACGARSPVTTLRSYHARAGFTRPVRCAICAAVINNDHFAGHASREAFANHVGYWFLLVQSGDDNGHLAHLAFPLAESRDGVALRAA